MRAVDELRERADISDTTWSELASSLTAEQILDPLVLAGWHHAISCTAERPPLGRH